MVSPLRFGLTENRLYVSRECPKSEMLSVPVEKKEIVGPFVFLNPKLEVKDCHFACIDPRLSMFYKCYKLNQYP